MNFGLRIFLISLLIIGVSCDSSEDKKPKPIQSVKSSQLESKNQRTISDEFKEYWQTGKAEITTYQLMQVRYGEIREGQSVTIFVTEDFLPDAQVKANGYSENNIPVLKLNQTKSFNTGIYPYSIMSSTFSPISYSDHAIKTSTSVQEWCGHVYMQLNNRKEFEVESHSYFEGEADQKFNLPKTWLESELWNLIRLNPEELPTGDLMIIPSFEYLRLQHKEIRAYPAFASIKQGENTTVYTINYPDLQRQLIFYFNNRFPYEIEKWEEMNSTDHNDTLRLRTTAIKLKRMKSDYWNQNKNEFSHLRDSLNLN